MHESIDEGFPQCIVKRRLAFAHGVCIKTEWGPQAFHQAGIRLVEKVKEVRLPIPVIAGYSIIVASSWLIDLNKLIVVKEEVGKGIADCVGAAKHHEPSQRQTLLLALFHAAKFCQQGLII